MRLLLALAGVIAATLTITTAAFAHAEPSRATPGDGAVLTNAPGEIVLLMSQELARQAGANDIDVIDAQGTEVTTVAAVVDNNDRTRLSVPLPRTLAPGAYAVKWKTLSSVDGDPASGELNFTYDPNGTPRPGKVQLREDLLSPGGETPAAGGPSAILGGGGDDGVTWVLVVAVAIGMFVLGAGGTFLLVRKQP